MTLEEVIQEAFYKSGHGANHTVCPDCHIDDFCHAESCKNVGLENAIAQAIREHIRSNIIKHYKAYIDLLIEELNEVVPMANNHGWRSSRFEQGENARQAIEDIERSLGV